VLGAPVREIKKIPVFTSSFERFSVSSGDWPWRPADRVNDVEISAPATIAVEVFIDRHLCCDYRNCLDMCSMGVFGLVDDVV
jgi:hypothetical protein